MLQCKHKRRYKKCFRTRILQAQLLASNENIPKVTPGWCLEQGQLCTLVAQLDHAGGPPIPMPLPPSIDPLH